MYNKLITFDTLIQINPSGVDFVREVGHRLSYQSGEPHLVNFLFQHLSVCV